MELQEFLDRMNAGETVIGGSDAHLVMHALSQEALRITMELNNAYHTPEEVTALMERLTGQKLEQFGMFPPFYTDCGKNIHIGRGVFINSGCRFQDQGGIYIGDGSLVGHNAVLATLNHDPDPNKRANLLPAPIRIGKNVWLGANVTVLPGVTIGDGAIIAVGGKVTAFAPGDRVYGRLPLDKIGAFAELCAVDAAALAKIPDYLSFEEAAAVPLTALTAMQAFDLLNAKAGETVFLSGGTGSLGTMAIPILKAKGLRVITSGSAKNRERVMALGVEQFIDYKTEDYAAVLQDVDCVLDTVGDKELEKEFSILKPGGTLVSLKGMPNKAFAKRQGFGAVKQLLFGFAGKKYNDMAKKRGQTYHFMFVHSDGKQLQEISELFAKLQIRPSVDAVFPLSEADAALKKSPPAAPEEKPFSQWNNNTAKKRRGNCRSSCAAGGIDLILRFLKQNRRVLYLQLKTSGRRKPCSINS